MRASLFTNQHHRASQGSLVCASLSSSIDSARISTYVPASSEQGCREERVPEPVLPEVSELLAQRGAGDRDALRALIPLLTHRAPLERLCAIRRDPSCRHRACPTERLAVLAHVDSSGRLSNALGADTVPRRISISSYCLPICMEVN